MKTAIVFFNLGGPDKPESVQPFLFNLFNDPAIIRVPRLFRKALASLISSRRAKVARKIYQQLGGGSPLLANTQAQGAALSAALTQLGDVRVFYAMRYWHPLTEQAVREVIEFEPDRVVLLPLYPQFSTTTTGSSLAEWHRAADAVGYNVQTCAVCCYPRDTGFVSAAAALIRRHYDKTSAGGQKTRLLFSAHGLPEKIVKAGDPYQWQVEQTAKAVVATLDIPDLDWGICYQSRVGPMKWIGPSTDAEIARAGAEKQAIVLFPIAFVSEHSETLVELDIEYRHLAEEAGVPIYDRVPTVGIEPDYISGLADLVLKAVVCEDEFMSGDAKRICPRGYRGCAQDLI